MLSGCFLAEYSDLEDKIEELEEKVAWLESDKEELESEIEKYQETLDYISSYASVAMSYIDDIRDRFSWSLIDDIESELENIDSECNY